MSTINKILEGTLSTFAEVKRVDGRREWFKVNPEGEHVAITEEEYQFGTQPVKKGE